MGPGGPEEMGGWSQQEVSSVLHPCWDGSPPCWAVSHRVSNIWAVHTGCLTVEVSLAVLCSAQHQENSRKEEGSCRETSFLPWRAPMDTYPRVDVQRAA